MSISFELPSGIEQRLRLELGDLNQAVKQAALVELYRQRALTHHELAVAVGVIRLETEAILKLHNVVDDGATSEELNEQISMLRKLTGV